jgi:gliding motility-associated-like protein
MITMKTNRFTLLFLLVAAGLFNTGISQMTVTNNMTVEQYVQNVLVGGGVSVSNVQFNAGSAAVANEQVGEFNDPSGNIGLASGFIMGSGDVTMAAQPNAGSGSTMGGGTGTGSDIDLASITPNQIYDECIVEFDFVPMGDTLRFSYVFASEEYPEYVCGTVNDAFGFFLSGPMPGGGTYAAENLALIPDPLNPVQFTTTPVSINTVNPGVAGTSGNAANCNSIDPNWSAYSVFYMPNTTNGYEYDGGTVVLEAKAPVICGQTYHIKLAIGDGGDGSFDSGVFLEEGSFSVDMVDVSVTTLSGDDFVIEGCSEAVFNFVRPDTSGTLYIPISMTGSAINGIDFPYITDSIYFNPGEDSVQISILPTIDTLTEPGDSITITIYTTTVCGDTIEQNATIYIYDYVYLDVDITNDTVMCPGEYILLGADVTNGLPPYTYSWSTGSVANTALVNVTQTDYYYFSATDDCDKTIEDSVWVLVPSPLTVSATGGEYCVGDSILITPVIDGGAQPYDITWNGPGDLVADTTTGELQIENGSTGTYNLTVTEQCGDSESIGVSVVIDVCDIVVPNVFTPNNDGQNDLFIIEGLEYHENSLLTIYNRWGKVVYENANYLNDWDGTRKNSDVKLADGTYYFILELEDMSYCEKEGANCQGTVQIIAE